MNRIPLLAIAGPTASGKSAVAVLVAKELDGEIVSADSMQVYRGMDIGTGKVTQEEMQGIPHHLLDLFDPTDACDIARWKELAKAAVLDIYSRGKLPVVCGGTAFYLQALLKDIDFSEATPSGTLRSELADLALAEGAEALHARLAKIDPESAEQIHPNNVKRVIRALEYHAETGRPISEKNETDRLKPSPYDSMLFAILMERETLYQRIEDRIDAMNEAGFLAETERIRNAGCGRPAVSMQALGYKEWMAYLDGERDAEETVRLIKRNTRHFAKRQLTWLRNRETEAILIRREVFHDSNASIASEIVRLWREAHA